MVTSDAKLAVQAVRCGLAQLATVAVDAVALRAERAVGRPAPRAPHAVAAAPWVERMPIAPASTAPAPDWAEQPVAVRVRPAAGPAGRQAAPAALRARVGTGRDLQPGLQRAVAQVG
jgi:hypothetical protein